CAPTGEREPGLERDFPMPTSVLGNRATDWRCGMANLLIRDPFLAAPFRLMDELMRSTGNGNRVTGFTPLVDVHETEEEYLVKIDLPGVKPDDVNVEVNENVLSISGSRVAEEKGQAQLVERPYGSFVRTLTLPQGVD